MRILVKLPSRLRPGPLIMSVNSFADRVSRRHDVRFLITIDQDDPTKDQVLAAMQGVDCISVVLGDSKSKIQAMNHGIDPESFDIILGCSDDMRAREYAWDEIIAADMQRLFPKLDGALHYPDGIRKDLCTLNVMGSRLYKAFGYIYHPEYRSLWCDNEFTDSCNALSRLKFIDRQLFTHHHHSAQGGLSEDDLYRRNNAHMGEDRDTYLRRRQTGFDLARVAANLGKP